MVNSNERTERGGTKQHSAITTGRCPEHAHEQQEQEHQVLKNYVKQNKNTRKGSTLLTILKNEIDRNPALLI